MLAAYFIQAFRNLNTFQFNTQSREIQKKKNLYILKDEVYLYIYIYICVCVCVCVCVCARAYMLMASARWLSACAYESMDIRVECMYVEKSKFLPTCLPKPKKAR